jgi:hypothetical protein
MTIPGSQDSSGCTYSLRGPASRAGAASREVAVSAIHGRGGRYLEGEMTSDEELEFLDHVMGCRMCAAALTDELQLREREKAMSYRGRRSRLKEYLAGHKRVLAIGSSTSVLAALAAVLIMVRPLPSEPSEPLTVRVEAGATAMRGIGAHPGDRLVVSAMAADGPHELRIYRGAHELVIRCPGSGAPACREHGRKIDASHTLTAPGEYQVLWLKSSTQLPPATGDREADLRSVRESGGNIADFETVVVN